jgi:NADH-quinone oxidoreductase subunit L
VGKLGWEERGLEYVATAATVLLAGFTFFIAYRVYVRGQWSPGLVRERLPWLQTLLERKYWFDEAYDLAFVRPMDALAGAFTRWLDRPVIDGAVGGVGLITEDTAADLSVTQSGYFRNYVLAFTGGAVILLAAVWIRGALG